MTTQKTIVNMYSIDLKKKDPAFSVRPGFSNKNPGFAFIDSGLLKIPILYSAQLGLIYQLLVLSDQAESYLTILGFVRQNPSFQCMTWVFNSKSLNSS